MHSSLRLTHSTPSLRQLASVADSCEPTTTPPEGEFGETTATGVGVEVEVGVVEVEVRDDEPDEV